VEEEGGLAAGEVVVEGEDRVVEGRKVEGGSGQSQVSMVLVVSVLFLPSLFRSPFVRCWASRYRFSGNTKHMATLLPPFLSDYHARLSLTIRSRLFIVSPTQPSTAAAAHAVDHFGISTTCPSASATHRFSKALRPLALYSSLSGPRHQSLDDNLAPSNFL
jgi:hypothetical protein